MHVVRRRTVDLSREASRALESSATTAEAEARILSLLSSTMVDRPCTRGTEPRACLPSGRVDDAAPATLADLRERAPREVAVVERRAQQSIRALRREREGRRSPPAMRVLTNDVLRLVIEAAGWRCLAELVRTLPDTKGAPLRNPKAQLALARAHQLRRLLTENTHPNRYRQIAALVFSRRNGLGKRPGGEEKPLAHTGTIVDDAVPGLRRAGSLGSRLLSESEAGALFDILTSSDHQHGAAVKERLREGASIEDVRHLLIERLVPITLNGYEQEPVLDARDAIGGLKFNLATNQWERKDRSWAYTVTLAQIFDYLVEGVIDGREEVKARLVAAATDPTTGELGAAPEAIHSFIDDLADAAGSESAEIRKLIERSFDLCFSTTDGGDTPVGALWELPREAMADLFAAMADQDFLRRLNDIAERERETARIRGEAISAQLADLLVRYPGVPRRHKRAHAALINLGLAGQSITQMKAVGGVLPRSETLVEPETLKSKYIDADHLKVRFLFTGPERGSRDVGYELFVISDETFRKVVDRWHFPPNHELLSYNLPIAGSGYLTFHKGRIVAIEDDTIMLQGKLPDHLPPAIEVLRARGFDLDEESIKASSRVLDWERFMELSKSNELPPAPAGDTEALREGITNARHGDRPDLVMSILQQRLRSELARADEAVARARTTEYAIDLLRGFQIFNVGARDFRSGDLPAELNEFSELSIDERLAPYLVRKVPL